jgi:hypothetical protein
MGVMSWGVKMGKGIKDWVWKFIWIRVQLEYKSIVNMGPYTVDCHLRLGRQQNHHLDTLYKTKIEQKKEKHTV